MLRFRLAVSVALLLTIAATSSCYLLGPGPPAPPNWSHPLSSGKVTSRDPTSVDLAIAATHLPFAPQTPTALTRPTQMIEEDRATGIGPSTAAVAFVYQTAQGQVDVTEVRYRSVTAAGYMKDLHAIVDQSAADPLNFYGSFAWVRLTDGTAALSSTTEDGSRSELTWVNAHGVEMRLMGPSLTVTQAVAIANSMQPIATSGSPGSSPPA